jgi:hypothetical protein
MLRRALLVFTAAAICSTPLWAQETRRVRATIEKVDGSTLSVKTRDGEDLKITLADKPTIVAIVPATLADLKPGTFVGSGATPGPDGSLVAIEVHIFPEAMRGTGEGHRPMEGPPQATMTNANVETSVGAVDGQVLTLKYKDGEKKIVVPPDIPIVVYVPGDKSELKAGAAIFISAATKQPDGTLQAPRVNVGRGVAPPM